MYWLKEVLVTKSFENTGKEKAEQRPIIAFILFICRLKVELKF